MHWLYDRKKSTGTNRKKLFTLLLICSFAVPAFSQSNPNILVVYVDDLGYGDVGCYGAKNVQTPNIDKLAANGLRFTDAHCTAATCTPSRFSLLTGSYAFRNNAAILPGDAPLLIKPGTPTLPSMLQHAGYTTAVIGKWHLGLGDGIIDWNKPIKPGPAEIGFNYSFIIPATLDRVPTVFVENQQVVNLDPKDPVTVSYDHKVGTDPTGLERPDLLKFAADSEHSKTIVDSISRIGYMSGGNAARWKDEEMADVLMQKTRSFLLQNTKQPFFLYLAYTDIHVPRDPNPRFKGKSTMGRRGDAIAQMDWMTGEVMHLLDSLHLSDNTLIIFSSDNGPVLNDGYDDKAEELVGDHKPAGPYNGGKYSAFEAGTRVPTIVYWPAKVKPGVSNAMLSQVDLFASLAQLTQQQLAANAAPDSFDMLDALLGNSSQGRKVMLEESGTLALRDNNWKYIASFPKATFRTQIRNNATGFSSQPQLYNLREDVGEQHDISSTNKEQLIKMQVLLDSIKQNGTRPGYKK
jgi:arylsulfatase A